MQGRTPVPQRRTWHNLDTAFPLGPLSPARPSPDVKLHFARAVPPSRNALPPPSSAFRSILLFCIQLLTWINQILQGSGQVLSPLGRSFLFNFGLEHWFCHLISSGHGHIIYLFWVSWISISSSIKGLSHCLLWVLSKVNIWKMSSTVLDLKGLLFD